LFARFVYPISLGHSQIGHPTLPFHSYRKHHPTMLVRVDSEEEAFRHFLYTYWPMRVQISPSV